MYSEMSKKPRGAFVEPPITKPYSVSNASMSLNSSSVSAVAACHPAPSPVNNDNLINHTWV